MSDTNVTCPACSAQMKKGHLYVRGLSASLHWSSRGDTKFLSRKNLEQIDLSQISTRPTGGQAVLDAWLCPVCDLLSFRRS